MNIEVVILAQGTQQRLGRQHGFKQLLPLPACNNVPILARTLRQLADVDDTGMSVKTGCPTLVTWQRLASEIPERWAPLFFGGKSLILQLTSPGNSSLKGAARYFEQPHLRPKEYDGTMVLLGDVVYSWQCLSALLCMAQTSWGFVGTSDLANDRGELWGVAWSKSYEIRMLTDLKDALFRHPPFNEEYQPGQLRRWITGWRRGDLAEHVRQLHQRGNYRPIDDYTMDVDLPADIPKLADASVAAAADDLKHGMPWPQDASGPTTP